MEFTGHAARKAIDRISEEGAESGRLNSTSRRFGDDGRHYRKGCSGRLYVSKLYCKSGLSGCLLTEKLTDVTEHMTGHGVFLSGASLPSETTALSGGVSGFSVLRTVMEIHTDEVI